LEYLIICLTSLIVSIIKLFSGFGLGTVLMPVFAIFFPLPIAIASTAVVHLLNNVFKAAIIGRLAKWEVVFKFGIPAAMASMLNISLGKERCMRKLLSSMLTFLTIPCIAFSSEDTVNGKQSMEQEEVSANEDLMREHGILNRLLLIYQEIARRIDNHEPFDVQSLVKSANIVRTFLEDYHEKLEEEFIFPKFERAGKLLDLVKTLKEQHNAGRGLTDYIISHSKEDALRDDIQRLLLSDYLKLYIRMFRPHEAREDTILFPEFKKIISKEEYSKLGDIFEEREHEMFGKDGFEKTVKQVEDIEKKLEIYNLNEFTPKLLNFRNI
jgi:hemerythrin-like domain-containing protein